MTIIAGFSSSRQGSAPLNLAAQLARTTGEKIIAAVVVERALPAGVDPIEDEYRGYLASRAGASLERVVDQVRGDLDISTTVHQSSSISHGSDGARRSARRRCRRGRVVVLGSARQDRPGQCDRAAGAHLEGAGGARPARLSVESRSPPAPDGRLRRRRGCGGPHRDQRRTGQAVEGPAADRVVHGAAVDDVRRLDRAFRRGTRGSAVDEQDHGGGGQAAQRGPRRRFRSPTWTW